MWQALKKRVRLWLQARLLTILHEPRVQQQEVASSLQNSIDDLAREGRRERQAVREDLMEEVHAIQSQLAQLSERPPRSADWKDQSSGSGESIDYHAFENAFRPADQIHQRLECYLPLLRDASPVLDLGCGRGELLALLAQQGISAIGVEANQAMVDYCAEQGIAPVHQAEATTYLPEQEAGSFGAIVAIHMLEHVSVDGLITIVREAHRALKPGGLFLAETVNPHYLPSFKHFWLDPTHQRPLFPEFMEFVVHQFGFVDIEVRYLTPTGLESIGHDQHGNYIISARRP